MARFYTPDELAAMDKDDLATIAEARSLEVTGTGSGGNVVKDDLVAAISADQDATGVNPALAPQPEQDVERGYRVVGPNRVHGHRRDETFRMVIPAAQERALLESGALVRVENTEEG